ncbi:MAG: ABC transporter ATP-binding protein [Candidatus Rokubacteria bacterium]|nr:ABC transporter ATP-binding protein [Candidatus Rokubacteria bacterium]
MEFHYERAERRRAHPFKLSGLSFAVARGEILGVIGPNSAGKTTVLRLLTKVLPPTAGEILLDGRRLASLAGREVARQVAVVPQDVPQSFPFTVGELVLMGRYPHAGGRFFETGEDLVVAREAMAATGVLDLEPLPLEELSGGERQRAILARALAQEPRLLVLDEPTAHLDLRYQAECAGLLRRLNRERGVTILLVSHDLGLAAEVSDRLLLLADGRLVRSGAPAEVLDETALEAAFGCPVVVEKSPTSHRPLVQVVWPDPERR